MATDKHYHGFLSILILILIAIQGSDTLYSVSCLGAPGLSCTQNHLKCRNGVIRLRGIRYWSADSPCDGVQSCNGVYRAGRCGVCNEHLLNGYRYEKHELLVQGLCSGERSCDVPFPGQPANVSSGNVLSSVQIIYSCIDDKYLFDMCSKKHQTVKGDNRNRYLVYRGGPGETVAGTCRCLLTTENIYISLKAKAVRLGARHTRKCKGTILSWGQGNVTDRTFDCSIPNTHNEERFLHSDDTTTWVELRIEKEEPALVMVGVYIGGTVNINCSGFEEASFDGMNATHVTSGPTAQTSDPNRITITSGQFADRTDSVLLQTTTPALSTPGYMSTDYDKDQIAPRLTTDSAWTTRGSDPITSTYGPRVEKTDQPMPITTSRSLNGTANDKDSTDHHLAGLVVSSVGTVLTLILCIAVLWKKKWRCRRSQNGGRVMFQVGRAVDTSQPDIASISQDYSTIPEAYHPYELLNRSADTNVSDYLRIAPAAAAADDASGGSDNGADRQIVKDDINIPNHDDVTQDEACGSDGTVSLKGDKDIDYNLYIHPTIPYSIPIDNLQSSTQGN